MNKVSILISFSLFFAGTTSAQYRVLVGAFNEQVSSTYFAKLGSGVVHEMGGYDLHRYYYGGGTLNATDADAALQKAKAAGFGFARVVDLNDGLVNCCKIREVAPATVEISQLKDIFFDFDRADLRAVSQSELRKLATILKQNPSYTSELRAHTDAKGSNEYNVALSMRRANAAKAYLQKQGIAASRIKVSQYGEEQPIAKNELNGGQDTEAGRQFNRRVELLVIDASGTVLNSIKEEINVPSDLKN